MLGEPPIDPDYKTPVTPEDFGVKEFDNSIFLLPQHPEPPPSMLIPEANQKPEYKPRSKGKRSAACEEKARRA
jgi:hypothetical protein